MDSVFDRLKDFFQAQGFAKTYWIAYSGGLDSHVLLHLCNELRKNHPLNLRAVYVNHQLSPNAAAWGAHCAAICHDLQIELIQKNIDLSRITDQSPEEAARLARYQVFAELIASSDILITAHQQDDQAETVLLQLLRGAGPKGLSAMPQIKPFAKGFHARPLLDLSRAELKKYAENQQLTWIEDESNGDTGYTRNFLRHDVLPILKKRWPSVTKTLARVADNCADTQALLEAVAAEDLKNVTCHSHAQTCHPRTQPRHSRESGNLSSELSVKKLLQLPPARQRQVLREWFRRLQFPIPSTVKMQQIQDHFLQASADKSPHIIWGNVELRRFHDQLYAMKCLNPHDAKKTYKWNVSEPLILPNLGTLQASRTTGAGLRADITHLDVCFRQGGERCRLPGRENHHDLKKLFQQWQVPPWQRDRIPLLYFEGKLVAVPGFYIDPGFAASGVEEGLSVEVNHDGSQEIA